MRFGRALPFLLAAWLVCGGDARAQDTWHVTNTNTDTSDGSFGWAAGSAVGGDTIQFSPGSSGVIGYTTGVALNSGVSLQNASGGAVTIRVTGGTAALTAANLGTLDGSSALTIDHSILDEATALALTSASATVASIGENATFSATSAENAIGVSNAAGSITIGGMAGDITATAATGSNALGISSTAGGITLGFIAATGSVTAVSLGDFAYGLIAEYDMAILGDLAGTVFAESYGSDAVGIVSIDGSVDIGSAGNGDFTGSVTAIAAEDFAVGVTSGDDLVIANRLSGTIRAQATTGSFASGLESESGSIRIGSITETGSVTATAWGSEACALCADQDIVIGDMAGTVWGRAITGDEACGMVAGGNITIGTLGGTVRASAGYGEACGMAAGGALTIAEITSTGNVRAVSESDAAFAIQSGGDMALGAVAGTVFAQTGGNTAVGIYTEGRLDGGDAATALPISGAVFAEAWNGLAVAVGADGAMNLYVTGILSGVDASGGGQGYAIRAGMPDGIGGWTTGNANNTVVLGTGAKLMGQVDLGDGTNTLGLLGTGTAFNLFSGVTHLVAGDGLQATYWTLSPTAADAYTVDDATIHAGATLDVNENVTITGETVNGGTLVFDIGTGAIKDGAISGPGGVTKAGEGALILSGATTYTGTTLVAEGQLRLIQTLNSRSVGILAGGTLELDQNYTVQDTALVNGTLITPQLTVAQEATLSGTGVIHGNVIGNGVISPGNSPGDLTVVGDLTLNAGSLLAMEITTFDNDTLLVTGATAIHGGTLRLSVASGIYRAGDSFTLVSSEQGITGDFDAVTVGSASPFLLFDVETGDDAVEATVLRLPYTIAATTRNAQGAAAGLFGATYAATTSMQILLGTIDFTSASEVARGLRQMSPEPYSALNETAFSSMRLFSDTIRDRAYARRSGGETLLTAVSAGNIGRLTQLASAAGVSDAGGGLDIKGTGTGMALFVKPVGQYQSFDNGHNRTGFQSWQYGVMAGGDAQVTDNFLAGFQVGYVHSDLRFKDDATSTGYADAFLGGVYASATAGGFYADGLVQAGAAVNHLDRRIEFGSISRQPTGKYTSFLFGASLSTGYEWTFGNFQAGPVGTLDYGYVSNPGFAESDPDLGLTVQGFTGNSLKTGLGAKISGTFTAGETTTISPDVALRWGHEFLNSSRSIEARYNGSPTSGFLSRTGDAARDTLLVDAGVSFGVSESTKLYVRYSGEFLAQGSRTQAGAVGVRYEF
ncbi:autotransporter outer membrane beta-barrel domain-containing protein [Desulfolutivibrio sulfoxidireducens]|uniref:autotransporter outer membrane beta-barrel domain-containing protein n=1 Tax=Desulfolutivibrio sulfoxidireducens TaxID=2773299 RepID=UPI00159D0BAF|nr:autotransporter outer membrane beta-barrel domain-containing protein [Desulfolutivibrio sulfoxidireducens]QLA19170.1 autotransporter domain-containing protein [Desulfolutivibrio sulfoxidireducens]